MESVAQLYADQHAAGRYSVHKHPYGASSWGLECMAREARMRVLDRVRCDRCELGSDDGKGNPLQKPIGILSNCLEILKELARRCAGRGGFSSSGGRHTLHYVLAWSRGERPPTRLGCGVPF